MSLWSVCLSACLPASSNLYQQRRHSPPPPPHSIPPSRVPAGHVDDAEGALEHPVVSFSLGLPAIFLLGGADKSVAPTPLLLRSGGCLVMGGPSRLCVHGVPAILTEAAGQPPPLLQDAAALLASRFWEEEEGEEEDEEGRACSEAEARLLARYLSKSRVNLNLRQVWPGSGSGGDGGGK